jgi:hypothetical protein
LRTPYLDIELNLDPLQADPQLQQTILLSDSASASASSDMSVSNKRKLLSAESDATSDTSGRFDDADESDFELNNGLVDDAHEARSVHSAKRRRSNDWPLRNEIAYDEHGMQINLSDRRSTAAKEANHSSCSPGAVSRDRHHGSPVLRARRSRFIEGSMNDRTSEKPPSIFLHEDASMDDAVDGKETRQDRQNPNAPAHRGSGIFRFGKVIASAFHPLGVWGNRSETWKGTQDGPKTQKEIMKQRQARAEKAYAELKKSGYKGTATEGNRVDAQVAGETWKAIQEKMDYNLPAGRSRPSSTALSQDEGLQTKEPSVTPRRHETGFPKLKSFHDLRKRASVLSIPAIRNRDVSPASPGRDPTDSHLKRQSRRDLSRQAKLLKKVSNLEDKLERARRELRGLSQDDESPVPTICLDDVHGRRFVPGLLPSLPSERLLQNQLGSSEAESGPEIARAKSPSYPKDNIRIDPRARSVTPKPRKLSKSRTPSGSRDGLPRKRKSPLVENGSAKASIKCVPDDSPSNGKDCGKADESTKSQTPRQTKLHKVAENDNAGSVGKKHAEQVGAEEAQHNMEEKETVHHPKLTVAAVRSSKRSSSMSGQRLKAKKSVRNLRQVDADRGDDELESTENPPVNPRRSFYLQDQHQLEANVAKVPVAAASSPVKGWGYGNDENIPPVPPLPKELLANVSKLPNPNPNKSGRRQRSPEKKKTDNTSDTINSTSRSPVSTSKKPRRVPSDGFKWPEDIF